MYRGKSGINEEDPYAEEAVDLVVASTKKGCIFTHLFCLSCEKCDL